MSDKPCMSLSLDLDNKWSYLKTHGSDAWNTYPSYFNCAIPRILSFLDTYKIRITFFIVGQDAVFEKNRDNLRSIVDHGHEIASHSFNHDPWLHLYSKDQLEDDLQRAEDAIEAVTQVRVHGFRGPGFSLSANTLDVLHERGYRYDATVFPNILNPLARQYFFAKSQLSAEEKQQRKALFGTFTDAFRSIKPYRWQLLDGELLELPVTTMPFLRIPIHFSYLVYLASYSPVLAATYLRIAIAACRVSRTEPSLLLHPLDFLGCDDDSDLAFFPGMNVPAERKLEFMHSFFALLLRHFTPVTMDEHISKLSHSSALPCSPARF